jgi:hypothetical protein
VLGRGKVVKVQRDSVPQDERPPESERHRHRKVQLQSTCGRERQRDEI